MQEALDFLKENNEVAFATIGNGRPQMRVFQIMKQSGTTLWFATGPHKRVYSELQENPAVEILSRNVTSLLIGATTSVSNICSQ